MDKRDEQSIDALKLYYQQNLSQLKSPPVWASRVPQSPNSSPTAVIVVSLPFQYMIPAMRPLNWLPVWSDATDYHACASRTGTP